MDGLPTTWPGQTWQRLAPDDAGMRAAHLARVQSWLSEHVGDSRFYRTPERYPAHGYRLVVVRRGAIVADWSVGVPVEEPIRIWSATKSIYSCMLGVLIDQGTIDSADDLVSKYYPEAMDVPDGVGPKRGRHVTDKDHAITLRHLITNTSGYMKPGETPGEVFHYQTYGMNILVHAMETACGLYDAAEPDNAATLSVLIDRFIRDPIKAEWGYYWYNFNLHPAARLNIFGNFLGVSATAVDMARLGWLWRCYGNWDGHQLVPEAWMRSATATAPDIIAQCPEDEWRYGHGFWTNDHLKMWPSLPPDSFAATGAGQNQIWVAPGLDLVIVQSPGLFVDQAEHDNPVLTMIAEACR